MKTVKLAVNKGVGICTRCYGAEFWSIDNSSIVELLLHSHQMNSMALHLFSLPSHTLCKTSYHIMSHHITLHGITARYILYPHITLHHTTSHHITAVTLRIPHASRGEIYTTHNTPRLTQHSTAQHNTTQPTHLLLTCSIDMRVTEKGK